MHLARPVLYTKIILARVNYVVDERVSQRTRGDDSLALISKLLHSLVAQSRARLILEVHRSCAELSYNCRGAARVRANAPHFSPEEA